MSNCTLRSFEVANSDYLSATGKASRKEVKSGKVRSKRKAVGAINTEFVIPGTPQSAEECENLSLILEKLKIEEEKLNQQQAAKGKAKAIEAALRQVAVKKAEVLKKLAEGKCEKLATEAETVKEQKETLELLKSQTQTTDTDKKTRTIGYALAGLVVLVGIIVFVKRR